ncbi:uncharacterized protein LY79DRAFT_246888 [Colletotrichum navitas]|uniref:Uncharacterized protein n=1 Tax=Colletotrichum navitas TaxID=681940 RepID=A0AAD8QCK6_9PEZI|nr:uncharacterized protein LY79DRAFT_246888 [Colletotrichum navitas]KAK1598529.1 hypothetical protein LY79DRAFT_246888 [Colletotrichum navitas]
MYIRPYTPHAYLINALVRRRGTRGELVSLSTRPQAPVWRLPSDERCIRERQGDRAAGVGGEGGFPFSMQGIPSSASACSPSFPSTTPPLYLSPSPPCVTFAARRRWRSFYNPSSRQEQQGMGIPSLASAAPRFPSTLSPMGSPRPRRGDCSSLFHPTPLLRLSPGARGRED